MENKMYLTQTDGNVLSFPYDWKQTFAHPFEMSRVSNEAQTVKQFVASGEERQVGIEILILLLTYTFATCSQIERLLAAKGLSVSQDQLADLLNRYLEQRLINKFTLSSFPMDHIPDDAFVIYCLDHASRHILSHFYKDDVAVTWKSTNSLRSSELVSKYLATNEFYLTLLTARGDELSAFQPTVDFTLRSRDIRLSATFTVMDGATPRDYLLEVVRKSDLPVLWRKKTNEQLAPFVLDKFWSRYFRLEPVMLFLAEDLKQAEDVAAIYHLRTESLNFRITTDEELLKGPQGAKFYKYEPNAAKSLVPVNAKLFVRSGA